VAKLRGGEIAEYDLFAHDFGIGPASAESVCPIGDKGAYSLSLLKGEADKERSSIVLANAAILLYLAQMSGDLQECYLMAREVLESGRAHKKMLAVREMVPRFGK